MKQLLACKQKLLMCVGHIMKYYRQVTIDSEMFQKNLSECPFTQRVNVNNFINFWMLQRNIPVFRLVKLF